MENKLAEFQAQLKVPKNQFNSFGKYKYRSAEDIIEAVKLVINPHGYHLNLVDDVIQIGERYYVRATATITDGTKSYSASAWAREENDKKGMDQSQITGAASSYARKYALNGLFAIDDTKDSDTTNVKEKPELTPEMPNWSKAVIFCKDKGIAQIEKKYFLSEENRKKITDEAGI